MWCRRMISLQEEWYHLMISTTLEWYRYNELLLIWYRRMISLQEEWYQIFNNDIVLWCTDIELISYRKNDIVTRRMISKNDIEVLKNDIEYFQEWYRYKKLTQLNWYYIKIQRVWRSGAVGFLVWRRSVRFGAAELAGWGGVTERAGAGWTEPRRRSWEGSTHTRSCDRGTPTPKHWSRAVRMYI